MQVVRAEIASEIVTIKDQSTGRVLSAYRIFQRRDGVKLVFYPVPKNANSSFKHLFSELLGIQDKLEFFDDQIPMWNEKAYKEKDPNKEWLWNLLPSKPRFAELPSDLVRFKLAVVRDPLERFFSAYTNRILWHRDQKFGDCSVDQVIDKLIDGHFDNKHFLPQTYFLGDNPGYFSHIAKMPKLDGLETFIGGFFGQKIRLKRLQVRHGKFDTENYSNVRLIEKIRGIYKSDYEFINKIEGNLV